LFLYLATNYLPSFHAKWIIRAFCTIFTFDNQTAAGQKEIMGDKEKKGF